MDGYIYWVLNDNKFVIDFKIISFIGGVCDLYILCCEDGKIFYMVVIDMVFDNGWDFNCVMVLLKFIDLVNWNYFVINMQKCYVGQEKLKWVWVFQIIFDVEVGKYLVYWLMKYGDGVDVIYYVYVNKEFIDLEGELKLFFIFENKKFCIDGDIVYKDGIYYLFYKIEGYGNGIWVVIICLLILG